MEYNVTVLSKARKNFRVEYSPYGSVRRGIGFLPIRKNNLHWEEGKSYLITGKTEVRNIRGQDITYLYMVDDERVKNSNLHRLMTSLQIGVFDVEACSYFKHHGIPVDETNTTVKGELTGSYVVQQAKIAARNGKMPYFTPKEFVKLTEEDKREIVLLRDIVAKNFIEVPFRIGASHIPQIGQPVVFSNDVYEIVSLKKTEVENSSYLSGYVGNVSSNFGTCLLAVCKNITYTAKGEEVWRQFIYLRDLNREREKNLNALRKNVRNLAALVQHYGIEDEIPQYKAETILDWVDEFFYYDTEGNLWYQKDDLLTGQVEAFHSKPVGDIETLALSVKLLQAKVREAGNELLHNDILYAEKLGW